MKTGTFKLSPAGKQWKETLKLVCEASKVFGNLKNFNETSFVESEKIWWLVNERWRTDAKLLSGWTFWPVFRVCLLKAAMPDSETVNLYINFKVINNSCRKHLKEDRHQDEFWCGISTSSNVWPRFQNRRKQINLKERSPERFISFVCFLIVFKRAERVAKVVSWMNGQLNKGWWTSFLWSLQRILDEDKLFTSVWQSNHWSLTTLNTRVWPGVIWSLTGVSIRKYVTRNRALIG